MTSEDERVPTLQVTGLVRRFGGVTALGGVVLTVQPGQIRALIGPNGVARHPDQLRVGRRPWDEGSSGDRRGSSAKREGTYAAAAESPARSRHSASSTT